MYHNYPCIVLELMPGGSLHDLLHRPPPPPSPPTNEAAAAEMAQGASSGARGDVTPVPEDLKCRIAREVAQGLCYLHSEQVIHRDVKAANVLLDDQLHASVTDFGVSTNFVGEHTAEAGTFRFMAPEVTRPNPLTVRSTSRPLPTLRHFLISVLTLAPRPARCSATRSTALPTVSTSDDP